MSDDLVMCSVDAWHAVAAWRGHTLALWADSRTVEAAESLARTALQLARERPGRSVYISVIRKGQRIPPPDVRSVYVRLGRALREDILCIAAVVEGSGFQVSAMRSMITGFGIAARALFPLRCFATLDQAADWAGARLRAVGEHLDAAELSRAFDALEQERASQAARSPE